MSVDQNTASGYDVAAARAAIPLLERVNYLNSATEGLVARPVEDKVLDLTRVYDEEGFHSLHLLEEQAEVARKRLAQWMNVPPEELAFTDNASHSVGIITAGLDWKAGDEILLSDEEHPALLLNCYYLEERAGVRVRRFKMTSDAATLLEELDRETTPQTRLIASSHIGALTGTRLPVEVLVKFARDRGIMSLLDGAQVLAQGPLDIGAIGADFYVSNGHKWLHGPKGSGLLVIKRERLEQVRPCYLGTGAAAYPLPDGTRVVLADSAKRYEFATRNFATYAGLTFALDWLEQIGFDNIAAHGRALSDYCKERVRHLPGARLRTPDAWEHSSAMVGFSIDDVDGVEIREWLRWQQNISIRRVLEYSGLRVAAAYFNTQADVDQLFDTIPQFPGWPHGS